MKFNADESKENSERDMKSLKLFAKYFDFTYSLKEARRSFEKEYLTTQLKKNHGNISKTADFIGMERSALHRKLKLLGVKDLN